MCCCVYFSVYLVAWLRFSSLFPHWYSCELCYACFLKKMLFLISLCDSFCAFITSCLELSHPLLNVESKGIITLEFMYTFWCAYFLHCFISNFVYNGCIWDCSSFDVKLFILVFVVKTSLGALSKNFVGVELDWRITLGTVTLVRVKSARITAIRIGDRYIK